MTSGATTPRDASTELGIARCVFSEVFSEIWPSLQQLEDAGHYDHDAAWSKIAEHQRRTRPSFSVPTPSSSSAHPIPYSNTRRARPMSLGYMPPPGLTLTLGSPDEMTTDRSPLSPSSDRLSPIVSVVRRATRTRPSPKRTQSTNDAPTAPTPPLVSPAVERGAWCPPPRSNSAMPALPGLESDAVSIADTTASKRAPRKLRKSQPPPPPLPSIQTNFLDVQHLAIGAHSPTSLSPISPLALSSPAVKRRSWRRSLPGFSSTPTSPAPSTEQPLALSPTTAVFASTRREYAQGSSSSRRRMTESSSDSSYLGDGEGAADHLDERRHSNSTASSTSSAWSAFRKTSSRPSPSREGLHDEMDGLERSFEVTRPGVQRSLSETAVEMSRQRRDVGTTAHGMRSSSSLNLDKIDEDVEDLHGCSTIDSMRVSRHSPAVSLSLSSGTRTRTPSSNTIVNAASNSTTPVASARSPASGFAQVETTNSPLQDSTASDRIQSSSSSSSSVSSGEEDSQEDSIWALSTPFSRRTNDWARSSLSSASSAVPSGSRTPHKIRPHISIGKGGADGGDSPSPTSARELDISESDQEEEPRQLCRRIPSQASFMTDTDASFSSARSRFGAWDTLTMDRDSLDDYGRQLNLLRLQSLDVHGKGGTLAASRTGDEEL